MKWCSDSKKQKPWKKNLPKNRNNRSNFLFLTNNFVRQSALCVAQIFFLKLCDTNPICRHQDAPVGISEWLLSASKKRVRVFSTTY
ncbi:protein of unknown function (plasmid) [Rhodovastum atsumiense]|nr:protein of unknown function [Rhodovastum atsumiense]